MSENKPFQDFLKHCILQADEINSCSLPIWVKKPFEKIMTVCFNTQFFYDLFWVIFLNQPKLKRCVNNYRKHLYAKRLFNKI